MKVLEKVGWLVFLLSLMIFVITMIYGVIKAIAGFIWDIITYYNDNLVFITVVTFFTGVIGFGLIRMGTSNSADDDIQSGTDS